MRKKEFEAAVYNNLNLENIYSKENNNDLPPVYSVKENAYDDNQAQAEIADIVYLVDLDLFKKYKQAVINGFYSLNNDFKKHFLEHNSSLSNDFIKIILVKYTDNCVSSPVEYSFTSQKELINDLENSDLNKKAEKSGPIAALNSINALELRNDSMRFLFHFCLGTDDCKNKDYSTQEIEVELRTKEFKYELIFFNEGINKEFYEKVSDLLAPDITIIKVSSD